MDKTLPALRAPEKADAAAVAALLRAREAADLGAPETSVGEIRAELAADGFARVAEDADGEIVGYCQLLDGDLQVAVRPGAEGLGVGTGLRAAAEEAARALGTRVLRQFVPTANTAARVLLLDAGWWPVHHYFRMQIRLSDAPQPPDVLARTFDPGQDAEAVWHLVEGAYAGVEGHLPQTFDAWRASTIEADGWDPALWLVAHDANGIVAAALGERDERGAGLIRTVAVAERARGRGHARALLALLLHTFRAAGLRSAHAVAHGPTAAAARIYEAVGMTAARQTERWEKSLAV